MRPPSRLIPLLSSVCVDPASPTVDEAELCRAVFGNSSPELCAWVDRVLKAEDARWPASTGVAYMSDSPYGFAGVETTSGVVVGSITENRVEGVSRPDAMAAMRAFAEGRAVLEVNDAIPVALLAFGKSPAEAEAPEPTEKAAEVSLPDPAAKILVEVSSQDETAVMDIWAMKRDGNNVTVWRRHDGKWESDQAFLTLVASGPMPKFLLMEPGDPVLASVLPQVDSSTSGKPFEPTTTPVAASGFGAYDPRDADLIVLVARGNRGGLKKAAGVGKGGNAETLRQYWGYGKGASKIRWGVGGDWYRCRKLLSKYMGVRAKGYCFDGQCEFTTRDGVMTFAEAVGTTQLVLTSHFDLGSRVLDGPKRDGYWVEARIEEFGEQPLLHVVLSRGGVTKIIRATPEHRWMASPNGRNARRHDLFQYMTQELQPGMMLASLHAAPVSEAHMSPDGIRAGIVFGDGARHSKNTAAVDLWGEKQDDLLRHFDGYRLGAEKQLDSGILGTRVHGLPIVYKSLPDFSSDKDYLYGWLTGYFAADGSVNNKGAPTLSSASREHLEHAKHVATLLGIATGSIGSRMRLGIDGRETELFHVAFARWSLTPAFFLRAKHRTRFGDGTDKSSGRWTVVGVEDHGEVEPVYCAVVPETEKFVLTEGIATFNCQNLHIRVLGYSTATHAKMVRGGKG